jgi:8-oxo-dGTP diphosphatase
MISNSPLASPKARASRPARRYCENLPPDLDLAAAGLYNGIRHRKAEGEMARAPVLAAGGIVLRQAETPLIAVVRLRKRNEWVLPKGRLDRGETPRAAAEREVVEETGHAVAVHEFLGTLVYEARSGSRVVHYWRMEAGDAPVRKPMRDVRAVDWLPLGKAVERLSRGYERAFLENVGPIALASASKITRSDVSVDRGAEPDRVDVLPTSQPQPRSLMWRIRDWLRLD